MKNLPQIPDLRNRNVLETLPFQGCLAFIERLAPSEIGKSFCFEQPIAFSRLNLSFVTSFLANSQASKLSASFEICIGFQHMPPSERDSGCAHSLFEGSCDFLHL